MKKFKQFITEEHDIPKKPVVFAFGRMNPPTVGHQKVIDKVHELAKKHGAYHEIVLSYSQDAKKNPLDVKTKVKHAKRFFPHTNIKLASKNEPTLIQHAARLNKAGHDHLIMVAGSDRVPQYEKLLDQYNGKSDKSGKIPYSFKKIDVVSAGQRDPDSEGTEGMSASKMREHATNNNFKKFREGVPKHVSDEHAKELFHDVKRHLS
jgi:predicted nucleotidyltransferase